MEETHDWVENAWIWSKNNRKLSLLHYSVDDVDVDEIAHALSNTCRFGGHSSSFYSVAEHCIIMAQLILESQGDCTECGRKLALSGLLHDASEYILTDVPKPFKGLMPEYEVHEARIQGVIDEAFGTNSKHPLVKTLDKQLVISEAIELFDSPEWIADWPVEPLKGFGEKYLAKYDPQEAYFAFMEMYEALTGVGEGVMIYD